MILQGSKLRVDNIFSLKKNDICAQVADLGIGTVHCSTDLATLSYDLSDLIEVTDNYGDANNELDHLLARLDGWTKAGT